MDYDYEERIKEAEKCGGKCVWSSNDAQTSGGISFAPSYIYVFPDGSREYIAYSFSTTEEEYTRQEGAIKK